MREVFPQPGYVEADLTALLASGQFVYTECFTIVPIVGSPLLYTAAQDDVSVVPVDGGPGRSTYLAKQLLISGLRFKTSIGMEVDQQQIDLSYTNDIIYQAVLSFPQALLQGRLDGATIKRDRFFAEAWGSPWIAGVTMFEGIVSSLDSVGRQTARLNVKSGLVLLNVDTPRDLWQPQCKNYWGDFGCGLNPASFVVQTTIEAGSTRSTLNWAASTDEFVMGTAHVEGGDGVTRVRTILRVDAGVSIDLIYPLDMDPTTGANVAFYPDCRREFSRCSLYHASPEEHFIGFPRVPVAETAV